MRTALICLYPDITLHRKFIFLIIFHCYISQLPFLDATKLKSVGARFVKLSCVSFFMLLVKVSLNDLKKFY